METINPLTNLNSKLTEKLVMQQIKALDQKRDIQRFDALRLKSFYCKKYLNSHYINYETGSKEQEVSSHEVGQENEVYYDWSILDQSGQLAKEVFDLDLVLIQHNLT